MSSSLGRRSLLKGMGAAGIGLSFSSLAGCEKAKPQRTLNFYNWDTYIGEHTLENFEAATATKGGDGKPQAGTGIKVNMSIFANNDELFAKMKTGNTGYDIIVPSNDFVARLAQANLLLALDHAKLPNLKNISVDFMNPDFDPGRKFSVPYTWLVLGIGYRKSSMPKGFVPDSWKYLFDSDMFKGKLSLLSESGDLFRLCAKYLGHSVNEIPEDMIKKIEAMLIKQKPNVLKFHEDDGQDLLMSKEVDIVMEYNGDIAQKMAEDDDLNFVIPKEGSQLNSDTWCIPNDAPNPDLAHQFINYMLDAEASKEIFSTILYPSPNEAGKALMPDSYKNNPVIFPSPDILAKCEYAKFEGPDRVRAYEEAFTRIKAS